MFAQRVEEVEQELNRNSLAVQAAWQVIMIGMDEQEGDIPAAYMSPAIICVLAYKILDIVQWLKMECPGSELPNKLN